MNVAVAPRPRAQPCACSTETSARPFVAVSQAVAVNINNAANPSAELRRAYERMRSTIAHSDARTAPT